MFSDIIRLYARGHHVNFSVLCEIQFLSGTIYVHNGEGVLRSNDTSGLADGLGWKGMQGNASVTGLKASKIGSAQSVTTTLNISSSSIRAMIFAPGTSEIIDRRLRFWGQFYDASWRPIDPRFHIYSGFGDRLTLSKSGPQSRRLELTLLDQMARRRRSANSMVTHVDQQKRDPGSTGFLYVQQMVEKTLNLYDAR